MKLQKSYIAALSAACIVFALLIIANNNITITPLFYARSQLRSSSYWNKSEYIDLLDATHISFFHPYVQQFLFLVNRYELDLFVMEPSLLYLTLTDGERQLLMERDMDYFPKNNHSFLLGMTEKQDQIKGQLVQKLVDIGFNYSQIIWPERNTSSHHFFVKNEMVIHVVVLFQRNTFFYSPAIGNSTPDVEIYLASDPTTIGKYPTSFDRFQLEKKILAGGVLQVPESTMSFLMHFHSARFLECNHEVSAEFHRKHWSNKTTSERNVKLETSLLSVVPILKSIMDPLAAPFWIASGTLLGWYRECGVIRYTTDHDFAAWSHFSPTEIYAKVSAHPKLKIQIRFGYPERGFELSLMHKSVKSDLFFMKEEANFSWYAGHYGEKYFQYIYSKFTLCSAELLGLRVLVPCTPETTIEEEYGNNWKEPISKWSYISSPRNVGNTFTWSPSEQRLMKEWKR